MNEYKKLLTLSYFINCKENYILSELAKIIGMDFHRIDKLIKNMIEEELLFVNEYLLRITEKGLVFIISRNMQGYHESDYEYINPKINPKNALAFDAPYVPERFMTKI